MRIAEIYIYVYILPFNNCDQQTDKSVARVVLAVWGAGWSTDSAHTHIYYIQIVSVGRER